MKKKGNFRKVVSGLLAGMTMLSTVLSPMTAYAAEIQPEEKPPLYEEVKELLDEDEVVTAKDYEIEIGSVFDVKSDYTGLEIKDDNKVKVTFEEAKNEKNEDFTTDHADTYKAVYYVEPVNQEHPKYQISRKLIVREKETEAQTETAGSEAVTESETAGSEQQTEEAEDSEADSEVTDIDADEFDDLVEQAQNQDTYDEESGLELHDVLEQAGDEGVDLDAMEEGEIATFEAVSAYSARSTQQVTIEKGPLYRYADYNLGTYLTEPYYISYGSVRATAYCVQPAKPGPGSGNYTITKIGDNQALAKVCYYGTDAAGSESFFANKHTDFSEGKRFIIIHMAASYANGSSDAFYGTNATGEALAKELYNYCVNKPEIPDVAMSFSKPNVKAYVDGNVQRTENIKFNASSQQKITMDLPKGVKLHNVSTGNVSAAGASVTIGGGTTFYLSAPLTQTKDVNATFSAKMKGSITKDYSAYKLTTNASVQDLAFVFGEGVADEKYVSLKVSWIEQATIEIVKKDDTADVNLAGAVFGVYSDEACTKLITQMPATDKNGKSSVTIIKTQDTVYLKEITAPQGYVVNATATNVKLVASKTSAVTVENKEQLAELTIYKEGQVLTGADVSENGTVFQYENRRQKNAVYNVYAGADIVTAYGTKVYSKGDLVKENLTTGENGSVTLKNLHLGTYVVKETKAPDSFYNGSEEKSVTLTYVGQNKEVVFADVTFNNERQKADVSVVKQDKDTKKPLKGGIFALYASDDIRNADGSVVVKKGTLIEKVTTGADGTAKFTVDLPIGYSYSVKEDQAPEGYVRNTEDGYLKATDVKFTLEDTAEIQKVEMKDEVPTGLLIINKNGEFLDKVTLLDHVKGTVEHLFEYVTGSLTDVTFDVFAAEDIKAADGVSEDYFKADEKVGTITTDSNGIAQMGDLPAGKYYVKEVKTAHGYVLDKEPRYVDLSYRDQDTPVITYDEKWQNARQKVKVTVLKKEKDTERVLAGGVFGLYTSEDIKNAKGEVLLEKDSLIEQRVTDEKGQITFTADLPVDGKYYVKEVFAPDGFVTTDEVQEFTFEYAGEDQAEVSYDFTFENQPTTVELTKTDLTTGEELPGAHLKVTDSDGNTVDEWTSTEEIHVIKELVVGKEYTMTETKPADGYVTAESITFTVENTAEIQKVEMKDDVTKVEISKTDITGETEIPGAKLTILDKDDQVVESWTSTEETHYIEKLPIGKYTLREEQAPKGYLLTSDVTFEVTDTGEVQKVAMKDDTAKGKVILNKTDKSSGEPLKGVEFELRDSKGKVLETLKTDAAGHAESELYEIATFKNGKYDTAIKYYLVETKTLDGYTLDQTQHEVTFAYADDSTPVVEVTFNLTNEKPEVPETPNTSDTPQSHEETKVSNAPKTGDSTNIWLPILLLVISTGGMAGLYICRKRKSK